MSAIADNANGTPVDARKCKAATEDMVVASDAPGLFEVFTGRDGRYLVDIVEPACTCEDFHYRSDVSRCKHIYRVGMTIGMDDLPDVDDADHFRFGVVSNDLLRIPVS